MGGRVTALVFDGMKLLDLAGPFEVFAEAAKFGAHYRLEVRSADGGTVRTSTGLPVEVAGDVASASDVGTALVIGGDRLATQPIEPALTEAAAVLAGISGRTASICTGAFVLAAAGLLDGRRATTHWQHARLLAAAYPKVRVEPDAIFVRDGDVFTSAGVSAGIDLALALVEHDHGGEMARAVARSLVVFLQRPGGQSQFSPSLSLPRPVHEVLRPLTDAIAADPAGDHSLPALAARAHLSPRHLTRLFRQELDCTPGRYVEDVRVDAAMRLLCAGSSVTDTARLVGIGSPETLRRIFVARLGVSPRAYRDRFATAGHR
ncbi:GlxA family transcriptional regulator [Catenuloplanes japonicus]|uniref:GlxA family transcriptional regulator n=1 Tax=Catenuloplanes japonicus TaxID=33876 RepID=UPI000524F432|nr:DJ-1/PfpI family protein [Catenuloplanes japonicus]